MKATLACLILIAAAAAGAAVAGAPQPAKPVASELYSGRWYEIARTPNWRQKTCQGDTSDFSPLAAGAFSVVETCHKGTLSSHSRILRSKARILPGSGGAKFTMSFLGGLIHQQYWILDHADDNAWALMATPGGHYIWLLARRPVMDAGPKAAALARMAALGYDPARLVFPAQTSH